MAPIGDGIEPVEVCREGVGIGNDEEEEQLEAEIPKGKNEPEESHESRKTRT